MNKKQEKKIPPSRVKYDADNPIVSVRLPLEDLNKLEEALKQSNFSKSDALRMWVDQQLGNTMRAIEQAKQESYNAGFKDGRMKINNESYEAGVASSHRRGAFENLGKYCVPYRCRCGKYKVINTKEEKEFAARAMVKGGWGHEECMKINHPNVPTAKLTEAEEKIERFIQEH